MKRFEEAAEAVDAATSTTSTTVVLLVLKFESPRVEVRFVGFGLVQRWTRVSVLCAAFPGAAPGWRCICLQRVQRSCVVCGFPNSRVPE